MKTTISGLQDHFALLYNVRNYVVNGSYELRALHMSRRIGRIVDAKRKNERMPGRLARAVCYFYSVVNYFGGNVDLERGMMEKFPPYGCLYCSHMPCDCSDDKRPTPTEFSIDMMQGLWKLKNWQTHLFKVYGHRNMGNFAKVVGRLTSEFGELNIIKASGPNTPITATELVKECEREAADVFSWILTIAYVEKIDLEAAIVDRYETCPGCKDIPCKCPVVYISADGKSFSTVWSPE